MGYPVYDADTESKRLCNEDPVLRRALTEAFGEVYHADGTLNRQRLAEILFSDKRQLARANAIIHPAVQSDYLAWSSRQGVYPVFVESAILLESILKRAVDSVIVVTADETERIERILLRDRCSPDMARRRMDSQMSDGERIVHADYVIRNNNSDLVIPQVEKIVAAITG